MAGLECLWPEDSDTDPQFYLHAECALPGNYRSSSAFLGRRDGFGSVGHSESLELSQPSNAATAPRLFH